MEGFFFEKMGIVIRKCGNSVIWGISKAGVREFNIQFGYQVKSGKSLFPFLQIAAKWSFRTWFGIQRLCFSTAFYTVS